MKGTAFYYLHFSSRQATLVPGTALFGFSSLITLILSSEYWINRILADCDVFIVVIFALCKL